MDWKDALKVRLVQCLAMIPGTSRSGATIIGGMLPGLSRKAATDFSFCLAIPTLIGAGVQPVQERACSAWLTCRCSCSGVGGVVLGSLGMRALAAALYRHAQLCWLCLVPHCLWYRGTRHGLDGDGALGGIGAWRSVNRR